MKSKLLDKRKIKQNPPKTNHTSHGNSVEINSEKSTEIITKAKKRRLKEEDESEDSLENLEEMESDDDFPLDSDEEDTELPVAPRTIEISIPKDKLLEGFRSWHPSLLQKLRECVAGSLFKYLVMGGKCPHKDKWPQKSAPTSHQDTDDSDEEDDKDDARVEGFKSWSLHELKLLKTALPTHVYDRLVFAKMPPPIPKRPSKPSDNMTKKRKLDFVKQPEDDDAPMIVRGLKKQRTIVQALSKMERKKKPKFCSPQPTSTKFEIPEQETFHFERLSENLKILKKEIKEEDDPELKQSIKLLIQRYENQLRSRKQNLELQDKMKEEKNKIIQDLKSGKKPFFSKKSKAENAPESDAKSRKKMFRKESKAMKADFRDFKFL